MTTTMMKRKPRPFIKMIGIFWALWTGCGGSVFAEDGGQGRPLHITQILSLATGRILVLTEDKGGLFYSDKTQTKWNQAQGLSKTYGYTLAKDAAEELFLTTAHGIFHSQDLGATWRKLTDLRAAFIRFSPNGKESVIKVWGKGLFKIDTWRQTKNRMAETGANFSDLLQPVASLPREPVQAIVFTKTDQEIFAGFFGKGIFRSTDGGSRWETVNSGLTNRRILALEVSPQGILYAGTYGGGLFRYLPADQKWVPVDMGLAGGIVNSIAFSDHGRIVAGTKNMGLLVSTDQGAKWYLAQGKLGRANIHSAEWASEDTLFAGSYGSGLFVSQDGGRTWAPRHFAYLNYAQQLAVASNGVWYVFVKGWGVLKTQDRGKTWSVMNLPFSSLDNLYMAVSTKNRLFVGRGEDGVFFTADDGNTWNKVAAGLPHSAIHVLRASPKGDLFVTSADGKGLFQLSEENKWQKITALGPYGGNYTCWDLIFLPQGVAVAYGLMDVMLSEDGSMRWKRERFGQHFSNLWVALDGRLWTKRMISTFVKDGAGEWKIANRIPKDRYTLFAPVDENHYAAIRIEGGVDLLQWTGESFISLHRGLANQAVLDLTTSGETILAATGNGLWVSQDRCVTWQRIELGP
jgi:photosystem II stability/assembly factor-like uncharacterized protein